MPRCAPEEDRHPPRGDAAGDGEVLDQGQGSPGEAPGGGRWLPIEAAARAMGVAPKTVRDWIKADRVRWRSRGNQGRDVLVPPQMDREAPGDSPGELERLRNELAQARAEVAELRERFGRAEGMADAREAQVVDLRAERDRLAAELVEARKPWAVRLVEAFRKR